MFETALNQLKQLPWHDDPQYCHIYGWCLGPIMRGMELLGEPLSAAGSTKELCEMDAYGYLFWAEELPEEDKSRFPDASSFEDPEMLHYTVILKTPFSYEDVIRLHQIIDNDPEMEEARKKENQKTQESYEEEQNMGWS